MSNNIINLYHLSSFNYSHTNVRMGGAKPYNINILNNKLNKRVLYF